MKILVFFLSVVFGASAMYAAVNWQDVPLAVSRIGELYPEGEASPTPPKESADDRRVRLKREAIVAGRELLAQPCDLEARERYRTSMISLGKQRLADSGCSGSIFFCNTDDDRMRTAALAHYKTPIDRQISELYVDLVQVDGLREGDLGIYKMLVGHPDELQRMMEPVFSPGRAICENVPFAQRDMFQ